MKKSTLLTAIFSGLAIGSASAVSSLLVDPLGDGDVATNSDGTVPAGWDGSSSTYLSGNGSVTESGGLQTYNPGSDNWTRSEVHGNYDYSYPASGGSVSFSWTVGNINVTTDRSANTTGDGGRDYRFQLNAVSANRAQGGASERWVTTEGSISLDLFANATDANGNPELTAEFWTKTDDQAVDSDGTKKGDGIVLSTSQWDWTTTLNTFTLEITPTGYSWSDDLGLVNHSETFGSPDSDFAALPAEFQNGFWAYRHGQNHDSGRGTGQVSEFRAEVNVIPEPSTSLLGLVSVALLGMRRRR